MSKNRRKDRQTERQADIEHAWDSDISGLQEIGGLLQKQDKNERIRGFSSFSFSVVPKISGTLTSMKDSQQEN